MKKRINETMSFVWIEIKLVQMDFASLTDTNEYARNAAFAASIWGTPTAQKAAFKIHQRKLEWALKACLLVHGCAVSLQIPFHGNDNCEYWGKTMCTV
jgi:hypothetical protein